MKYRKQGNRVYLYEYHLVFQTKYYRKIFNEEIFQLKRIIEEHCLYFKIIEVNYIHIHLLMQIPPKRYS
ncbi:MAG: transposase [Syntrophobacterales bacterium]|nr:transposase [Syntrophobacterales bacterium]